ncbi:glycosyltransferase family 4 protein [Clostridium algoriphilum]|uniref:glycosyltransferase family 4 protein n=1 Tax=Clostridium algoriphilum TaxID=198347 RepID=UPI001CF15AF4|nr:glycosyltransferase family 4 protein [Clostridium algoriphilum]MCB2293953.1 glycosyltransferase family 4 protein [Clostridium algoriphilum]
MIVIKKKICFIAQFPPPIHGLSKAIDTLYNSKLKDKYEFSSVDITNNKKIISNIFKIIKNNADLYYLTIAQTTGGNLRDLIVIKLLLMKKKKIMVHLHGGYYRTMIDSDCKNIIKNINLKLFKKLNGAIVLGKSLKYIFKDIVAEEKIHVVENCVDEQYLISEEKFNLKIKELETKKRLNIVYLSNFIESKGYKDILEIAKICKDNNVKKFNFIFAGKFYNYEDKNEFNDFINENKLQDIVDYRGIVQGNEKLNMLQHGDVFMLLTRYPKEGQPISIIEGMANGMSVITTNYAGIPDLIEENENGYFVDYKEHKEIFKRLLGIERSRDLQKKLIINNRKKVLNMFTEAKYINKMDKVFTEVLECES